VIVAYLIERGARLYRTQRDLDLASTSSLASHALFLIAAMASAPLENNDVPPATQEGQKNEEEEVNPEPQEAKMPTRRDVSLKEFLNKMDDYAPIVSSLILFPLLLSSLSPCCLCSRG
jgi:hypothetical protein